MRIQSENLSQGKLSYTKPLIVYALLVLCFSLTKMDAYGQSDCTQLPNGSIKLLECQAASGDKEAQYQLGVIAYKKGDIELAIKWLNQSWAAVPSTDGGVPAAGNVKAAIPLAEIKRNGRKLIIEKSSSNATNIRVEGSLQSTLDVGCVVIDTLSNNVTPADLFRGVKSCLDNGKIEEAAPMYLLARLYGVFDAKRVADRSAGQGIGVLQMNTFGNVPHDVSEKLKIILSQKFVAGAQHMANFCSSARKLGHPIYQPDYMILHGINAITGIKGNGLIPNFNAEATWKDLLLKNCPLGE